jgi:hypothetical protein
LEIVAVYLGFILLVSSETIANHSRTVSRESADKVLRTFKKVHFAKKAFLVKSKDSLQFLLQIARNEEFGQAIQTLVLCIDELPQEHLSEYCRCFHDPASSGDDTQIGRMWRNDKGAEFQTYLQKQQRFIYEEHDLTLLTTIFAQLKRIRSHANIQITARHDASVATFFVRTLEERTAECLRTQQFDMRAVCTVLEALALSCLVPSALQILGYTWQWSIFSLSRTKYTIRMTTEVLANVTRLDLAWASSPYSRPVDIEPTVEVLAQAPCLQKLSFYLIRDAHAWTMDDLFVEALLNAKFPALRILDLLFFRIRLANMATFISNNPGLESLRIYYTDIEDINPIDYGVKYEPLEKKFRLEFVKRCLRKKTGVDKVTFRSSYFHFRADPEASYYSFRWHPDDGF